jgi:hypothetical protein
VLFGIAHDGPRCRVLVELQGKLGGILYVPSLDGEVSVGVTSLPFENEGTIHAACKTRRAVDHVQWVVGLGFPQVVDEQYGGAVIGCYGAERVYCLAVLVVLRTPARSSRFEACQRIPDDQAGVWVYRQPVTKQLGSALIKPGPLGSYVEFAGAVRPERSLLSRLCMRRLLSSRAR